MYRLAALVLLIAPCAQAEEAPGLIEVFGLKWQVPIAADWKVEDGVLHLLTPRPSTAPRRPSQYALAMTPAYTKATVELEMMPEPFSTRKRHNSLIIVYAWKDANHFNYVHLSVDAASEAPVHNGLFHVYGGDRVRMSSQEGPATLKDGQWHKVKLVYDGTTGRADVWVNGQTSPSMRAVDMSLGAGRIGIGSFFDMGTYRNLKISGN